MTVRLKEGAGLSIAISASTVEQTGIKPGHTYRMAACDGSAVVEFGAADATAADAGYSFMIPRNTVVDVLIPSAITAINVIEANTASDAGALLGVTELEFV